jgi:hypothetical protein
MPSTLTGESQPAPAGGCTGFDRKQGTGPGANGSRQNVVHIIVLLCLYWLLSFAAWVVPRVVAYGRKVAEAEQKHGYILQLLLAAAALLHAVVEVL